MDESKDLLPWHESAWTQILAARAGGRLPHALLLHGPKGLGKERFARQLAALCLCQRSPAGPMPCGSCRGCRLVQAGTHPDLYVVEPLEGKIALSIDQIRELIGDLTLQPHMAALRVAIICPAEAMTPSAANALLKTLEEPAGATLLALVTARPSALPATVRSRCQALRFRAPSSARAQAWLEEQHTGEKTWVELLELSAGAPLLALTLARSGAGGLVVELERDLQGIAEAQADPLAVATTWAGEDRELWWSWLHTRVAALIRQKTLGENPATGHSAVARALPNYARNLKLTALLDYWDMLLRARPALETMPAAPANEQERRRIEPILDSLLIPWAHGLEGPGITEM
jgi:DNA polymerase-3 subunit delta'